MLELPIRNLILEGPDCSGKTTLIRGIHNTSKYRWHIIDRSQISRYIFSNLYHRDIDLFDLHLELSNLNNVFVILLPNKEIIKNRFEVRGDDIHNIHSLMEVYDVYEKNSLWLKRFPNVHLIEEENPDPQDIVQLLRDSEQVVWEDISHKIDQFVDNTPTKEAYPFVFTVYDDGKFQQLDKEILNHSPEKKYYQNIFSSLVNKITNEMAGNNVYNRVENEFSRRFVYADSDCISFIQVANRDGVMDFHCVLRSSNIREILPYDLKFLYFLAHECYHLIGNNSRRVRFRFDLNSAHILD